MSIAAYIKVIGRGKDGARSLDIAQARDLLDQILDGQASDLEVGAFCLAMRIKSESADELEGFVQSALAHCLPLAQAAASAPKGIVVLPSYNGARKQPNLTALLAQALAKQGVGVLVHGPATDPTRLTTAQVFAACELPVVADAQGLSQAWQAGLPAFIDIDSLSAPLAKLLAVRWAIGLRNPGHTIAKLLNPFAALAPQGVRSLSVVNHTHPEYGQSLAAYLLQAKANALLMRGTEGEPVSDARRQPAFNVFIHGQLDAALSQPTAEGVLKALPALPTSFDAATTARYIASVMQCEQVMPAPIQAQVDCLVQALARTGTA